MEAIVHELQALALLIAANGLPVVVAQLVRNRGALPLDFGHVMPDGERLFGSHKTWRGIVVGTLGCALLASAFGLPLWLGAAFGALSLAADAGSSAAKRRMRLAPGTEALGLDQLAEALLPLLVFAQPLQLSLPGVLVVTTAFFVLNTATVRLRHSRWL